jgi:hypothetical protein
MSTTARVIAELSELIRALDRRVPQIERAGELHIAQDAAKLRSEALDRINELRRAASDHRSRDSDFVDAVMTDDGGPVGS